MGNSPDVQAGYRCMSTDSWAPLQVVVDCKVGNPAAFPCDKPCNVTVTPQQTQNCPAGTRCLDPSDYLRVKEGPLDAGAICVFDGDAQVVDAEAGD
jgi:hypothetical protein